jgi:hypothetical protein
MRLIFLFGMLLISSMNFAQSYELVTYNKCAIRKPTDSDYSIMDLNTKFGMFDDGGETFYFYSEGNEPERFDIMTDVKSNYVDNYKYYEFIALNSGGNLVQIRYFSKSRENGIYLVFDDGTNIQFFYEP